ncbi:MAG TPA: hypothetical protein VNU95_08270 [Candidatus Acidoferrales bacterium]|nr:hypothetical protein [Candidatus Acidoferrales bacterium]
MAAPLCTPTELKELIKRSGFPFELQVAEQLQAYGFQVKLSEHFYNPLKQKDSELDILATQETSATHSRIGKINLHLELAVECKDNSLPYVLFGFPAPQRPPIEILDMDCRYMKIRSTDDKIKNQLGFVAFGDTREEKPRDIKPLLHQFGEPFRFHHATLVEMDGGKLKLHESERLRLTLGGLGGYGEFIQDTWIKNKHVLEEVPHNPTLWVTFFLLVHNGQHFRYTNKNGLEAATHTPLFTTFHSNDSPTPLAIDFIQFEALPSAVKKICESFNHLAKHLLRYLSPSKRPVESE